MHLWPIILLYVLFNNSLSQMHLGNCSTAKWWRITLMCPLSLLLFYQQLFWLYPQDKISFTWLDKALSVLNMEENVVNHNHGFNSIKCGGLFCIVLFSDPNILECWSFLILNACLKRARHTLILKWIKQYHFMCLVPVHSVHSPE